MMTVVLDQDGFWIEYVVFFIEAMSSFRFLILPNFSDFVYCVYNPHSHSVLPSDPSARHLRQAVPVEGSYTHLLHQ